MESAFLAFCLTTGFELARFSITSLTAGAPPLNRLILASRLKIGSGDPILPRLSATSVAADVVASVLAAALAGAEDIPIPENVHLASAISPIVTITSAITTAAVITNGTQLNGVTGRKVGAGELGGVAGGVVGGRTEGVAGPGAGGVVNGLRVGFLAGFFVGLFVGFGFLFFATILHSLR